MKIKDYFQKKTLVFTNTGRCFKRSEDLSKEEELAFFLESIDAEIQEGETIADIVSYELIDDAQAYISMVTKCGFIKKTRLSEYNSTNRTNAPVVAALLHPGDEIVSVRLSHKGDDFIVVTENGKSIRFGEDQVKASHRDTLGVTAIQLQNGDRVVGFEASDSPENQLLVVTKRGIGKRSELVEYPKQFRGGLGIYACQLTHRTGKLAAAALIKDPLSEEVCLISEEDKIAILRIRGSVPLLKRNTQGVILIKLSDTDFVSMISMHAFKEEHE